MIFHVHSMSATMSDTHLGRGSHFSMWRNPLHAGESPGRNCLALWLMSVLCPSIPHQVCVGKRQDHLQREKQCCVKGHHLLFYFLKNIYVFNLFILVVLGLSCGMWDHTSYLQYVNCASGKESACQCKRHKRHGFNTWVGKIPWNKAWPPTLVFLPEESHGQRSQVGYSPWGHKESDTTKQALGRHV